MPFTSTISSICPPCADQISPFVIYTVLIIGPISAGILGHLNNLKLELNHSYVSLTVLANDDLDVEIIRLLYTQCLKKCANLGFSLCLSNINRFQ